MLNVFPYRQAITCSALAWDPCSILLMASETMAPFLFIFFICRASSIARATRLSSHYTDNGFPTWELLVKDVASPRSLCNTGLHTNVCNDKLRVATNIWTHEHTDTHTHRNLIWPWIKSHPFVFQTVKQGEGAVLGVVYTSKVITISSRFRVVDPPPPPLHQNHTMPKGREISITL